jgi:hypothetical protein
MNRNAIYALIVSATLVAGIVTIWKRHKSDPIINPQTPAGPAGVARNEGTGGFRALQPKSDLVSQIGSTPEGLEAARQRRHEQFLALLVQTEKKTSPPVVDPSTISPDSEIPPPSPAPVLAQVTPSPTPRGQSNVPDRVTNAQARPRQTQIADLFDHDSSSRPPERRRSSNADFESVNWHEPTNAEWLMSERRSLKSSDVRSRRISVVTNGNAVNIVVPAVAFGTTSYDMAVMRPPVSTINKLQEIGTSAVSMRAHVTLAAISTGNRHEMPPTVAFVADELVRRGVFRSDISIHMLNLGSPVSPTDALDRRSVSIALETTEGAFHNQTIHDLTEMLLHSDATLTH